MFAGTTVSSRRVMADGSTGSRRSPVGPPGAAGVAGRCCSCCKLGRAGGATGGAGAASPVTTAISWPISTVSSGLIFHAWNVPAKDASIG
jgi:hypothetical protein